MYNRKNFTQPVLVDDKFDHYHQGHDRQLVNKRLLKMANGIKRIKLNNLVVVARRILNHQSMEVYKVRPA